MKSGIKRAAVLAGLGLACIHAFAAKDPIDYVSADEHTSNSSSK